MTASPSVSSSPANERVLAGHPSAMPIHVDLHRAALVSDRVTPDEDQQNDDDQDQDQVAAVTAGAGAAAGTRGWRDRDHRSRVRRRFCSRQGGHDDHRQESRDERGSTARYI